MPITGGYVKDSVLAQLKTAFPTMKRYKERQEQKVVRPCFFVYQLLLGQDKRMGPKYTRLYRIRITWLPLETSSTPRNDCDNMGHALLELFRQLVLPDRSCFSRNLEFETVDNELQFTAEFPIFAEWVEEPDPSMQVLDVYEEAKY